MPFLPSQSEFQGLYGSQWNNVDVDVDGAGPTYSATPDGMTASLRLLAPWSNQPSPQTISANDPAQFFIGNNLLTQSIVGFPFWKIVTYGSGSSQALVPTLYRQLPDVFPYYNTAWGYWPPASGKPPINLPQLQVNYPAAGQPQTSAKGYPLYAIGCELVENVKPQTPPPAAIPAGMSLSPPHWNPGAPGAPPNQPPWGIPIWYDRARFKVTYGTLPYRVCFKTEAATVYPPYTALCPEAVRFTSVTVTPTSRILTGNLADWAFDPPASKGIVSEDKLQQVSNNFVVPETSSIITVIWHNVDPACFNTIMLSILGGTCNEKPLAVGVSGFDTTLPSPVAAPCWVFKPFTLLLLGYSPIITRSVFGYWSYNIKIDMLYEPQGVNSALNPAAIPPGNTAPLLGFYNKIHFRNKGGVWNPATSPAEARRPFPAADYNQLFQLSTTASNIPLTDYAMW